MSSRNTGIMWFIVVLLLVVIAVLGYFLIVTPAPTMVMNATTTPSVTTGTDSGTDTGTNTASGVIVTAPKSGASVPKSFTVTGEAPGAWYFEASFPIKVLDSNNKVIGSGHATALSDWMTTGQVPFKADITTAGYSGPATLVLSKDNPSGMPENDRSLSVPIVIN